MRHLTPDELIDAMDGLLAADRQAHLAMCDECQGSWPACRGVGRCEGSARPGTVSALLAAFLRARGHSDPARRDAGTNWPSWLRWQILVPLGAVAMIVLALAMNLSKRDVPGDVVDNSSPAVEQADDTWVMVSQLVGDIDLDTASAAGVIEPGVAEEAMLQLTAEEQQELTRLLKAELQASKIMRAVILIAVLVAAVPAFGQDLRGQAVPTAAPAEAGQNPPPQARGRCPVSTMAR